MKLTKEETVSEIVVIVDALKVHLDELKIRTGHLDLHPKLCDLEHSDLHEGLVWLRNIVHKEYAKLTSARKLLTPEQWRRYELWGDDFAEHQESVILHKAQVELRKVLVSQERPKLFKKGWVHEQLDTKGDQEINKRENDGDSGDQD